MFIAAADYDAAAAALLAGATIRDAIYLNGTQLPCFGHWRDRGWFALYQTPYR